MDIGAIGADGVHADSKPSAASDEGSQLAAVAREAGTTPVALRPHPPAAREMLQCPRVEFELKASDSHLQPHKHRRVHRFHPHRPSYRLPRMPPLSPPVDAVAAPSRQESTLFDARVTHQQCTFAQTRRGISASAREARQSPRIPAPRSLLHRQQRPTNGSSCRTFRGGDSHGHVVVDTFANRSKYRRLRKAGGVADTFDPWNHHADDSCSAQPPEGVFVRQPMTVGGLATAVEMTIGGALAPAARQPHPQRPSVKQKQQQHHQQQPPQQQPRRRRQQQSAPHEEMPHFPLIPASKAPGYSIPMEQWGPLEPMHTAAATAAVNTVNPVAAAVAVFVGADEDSHRDAPGAETTEIYPIPPGPSRGFPVAGLPRTPTG